jgi:hypothetical protein
MEFSKLVESRPCRPTPSSWLPRSATPRALETPSAQTDTGSARPPRYSGAAIHREGFRYILLNCPGKKSSYEYLRSAPEIVSNINPILKSFFRYCKYLLYESKVSKIRPGLRILGWALYLTVFQARSVFNLLNSTCYMFNVAKKSLFISLFWIFAPLQILKPLVPPYTDLKYMAGIVIEGMRLQPFVQNQTQR